MLIEHGLGDAIMAKMRAKHGSEPEDDAEETYEEDDSEHSDSLKLAIHELMDAVRTDDREAACAAFKKAFAACESEPHDEAE